MLSVQLELIGACEPGFTLQATAVKAACQLETRWRKPGVVAQPPWTAAALLPLWRGQPCWPSSGLPASLRLESTPRRRRTSALRANRVSSPGSRAARPQSGSRAAALQSACGAALSAAKLTALGETGRRRAQDSDASVASESASGSGLDPRPASKTASVSADWRA